jgi:hypothetical protein
MPSVALHHGVSSFEQNASNLDSTLSLSHLELLELFICLPQYEGFTKDDPTVKNFWQVVHSMTMEQKRKLLAFTTGCDRAPVGGLGQLTLIVQVQ